MKKHKKDHKKAKTEENTGYLLKYCSGENTFKPRVKVQNALRFNLMKIL